MDRRAIVKEAQTLLKSEDGALRVDGIWGVRTDRVFVAAPKPLRDDVAKMAVSNGLRDIADLRGKFALADITLPQSDDRWVSEKDMDSIISRVSLVSGVPATVLKRFLLIEAPKHYFDGVLYFDRKAVNGGGYRGLFQFSRGGGSWRDASRYVEIGNFDTSWADAYQNTLAAAGYLKFNSSVIRSTFGYKGPITGDIAYLMHNQGAGGAYRILRGESRVAGAQSKVALETINRAIQDARLA